MSLTDVCRICANKIKGHKRDRNIFKYMRGRLLEQLKLITGVELTTNQGLPEFVCERCFSELDLATKFRERCIFSQKYLLEIRKKSKDQSIVHIDLSPEPLDEQLIDADQLEVDDDEQFVCYQDTEEDPQDLEEFQPDEEPSSSVIAAAEATHQADLHEQQIERAAKRRRNFFICDECGTLFHDEYLYNEHLNGHQNRREMNQFFPCPECPETFKKKALLKLHRAQFHSTQRKFKCTICNEVFAAMGAKLRHDK
ncbi:uncharacterized protein Dere_GG12782, isoform B [Drosophila erecta]|nr:uncharacterized protein Dere_GG12782, isoform B [Drosophila erecta]